MTPGALVSRGARPLAPPWLRPCFYDRLTGIQWRNELSHRKLNWIDRLSVYLQRRLQSVLNAAASLVFRLRRYDHATDALATLHWLRLPQHVDFKVAVTAFRVLHGLAPPYLNQLARVADLPSLADFGQHRHTNCSCHHSG